MSFTVVFYSRNAITIMSFFVPSNLLIFLFVLRFLLPRCDTFDLSRKRSVSTKGSYQLDRLAYII